MRCFSILILIFFNILLTAQVQRPMDLIEAHQAKGLVFEKVDVLRKNSKIDFGEHSELLAADYFRLEKSVVKSILSKKPKAIQFSLAHKGSDLEVQLVEQQVVSPDFILTAAIDPENPISYTQGLHYRGIIKGNSKSVVAISFFEDEMMGLLMSPETGNLNLGVLESSADKQDYVLFSDTDQVERFDFTCGTTEIKEGKDNGNIESSVSGCVRVYIEADNDLFANKGSVTATANYITGFFNVVATIYSNEQISTVISQINVWSTPDSYPSSSSGTALSSFRTTRTSFNGDIAHLVALDPGGLGGVAYLDILCSSSSNYAYSDINSSYSSLPNYSWTVMVFTHEMGHNLGSNHTQWCGWTGGALDDCYATEGGCAAGPAVPSTGGTIMSYCHTTSAGIDLSSGFGTQPGNKIRTQVSGASCLAASCTPNSCASPVDFEFVSSTSTTCVFSWAAGSGNNSYNLRHRLYGATSWTTITNATSPYTLTGLSPSTGYEIEIQGVCSGGSSDFERGIFFKSGDNCVEPSAQSASSVTGTSAILAWTENDGATSWEIKYGADGFNVNTAGALVAAPSNPFTLSGLIAATSYDWYVRSNCVSGGQSGWEGPHSFGTILAYDDVANALLLNLGTTYDVTNGGSTLQAGEPNPDAIGVWGTAVDETAWFRFVAPTSGTVRITTDFSPQGSNDDTQLALYAAGNVNSFSTFTLLASDDDSGVLGTSYNARISYSGLTAGTTYYIQADGYQVQGTFKILVEEGLELVTLSTSCDAYTASVNGTSTPTVWRGIYENLQNISIGDLVASIKTSENLGTVTLSGISRAVGNVAANKAYLGRYFDFQSTNTPTQPVSIRLFFTDADLTELRTFTGNNTLTISDLEIEHYDGVNENCDPADNAAGGYTNITAVTPQQLGSTDVFYLEFTVSSFSEMPAIFNSAPLPIELSRFGAQETGATNLISWATASEKDVAWHIIQRSSDGFLNWSELIRQEGKALDTDGAQYQAMDERPWPVTYYRLLTRDLDGTEHFSDIVSVKREKSIFEVFEMYPNPSSTELSIRFYAPSETVGQCKIVNILGQQVRGLSFSVEKGAQTFTIPTVDLMNGTYSIYFEGDGIPIVPMTFVVQK